MNRQYTLTLVILLFVLVGLALPVVADPSDKRISIANATEIRSVDMDDFLSSETPQDIGFDDDGDTMFILTNPNSGGPVIHEFKLSSPWDPSTASDAGTHTFTNISSAGEFTFKPDGAAIVISGSDHMVQFNLTDSWNLSARADYHEFPLNTHGADVGPQGQRFVVIERTSDNLELWTMTSWNISTLSENKSSSYPEGITGLFVNPHGTQIFTSFNGNNNIHQYNLTENWNTSTYTYTEEKGTTGIFLQRDIWFNSTGEVAYTIDQSSPYTIVQWDVPNGWGAFKTKQPDSSNKSLILDVPELIRPNQTGSYTVTLNNSSTLTNVTENATVVSGNTSILTVNQTTFTLHGNATANATVNVTANYTLDSGATINTTEEVVVAEVTVDNLEILPPNYRPQAAGDDPTIFFIMLVVLVGSMAAKFAGSTAAIGVMQLAVVIGWFGGWVSLGLAMVSVYLGLFIGLNTALNIDYGVR